MRTSVFVIGFILIVLGIFAQFYSTVETNEDFGGLIKEDEVNYPLRNYGFPLLIGGAVLVILSFIIPTRDEMERRNNSP